MLKAIKENRVLRIPDEKLDEYKALGYSIMNMNNEFIYEVVSDKDKIQELEAIIDELKSSLEKKDKEISKLKKKQEETLVK